MAKKRTLKRWKFLAWQALSRKKRSIGVCQRCGKVKEPKNLDGHHIIRRSKGNYAMFCEDNIIVLCDYCHRRWWHGTSTWEEQRDLVARTIGLDRYEEIKWLCEGTVKYKDYDYEAMIEKWTKGE